MLQGDAIALQYHQGLPVQGQGARLGCRGHCEPQFSSIGGHLTHMVDSAQLGSPQSGPPTAPATSSAIPAACNSRSSQSLPTLSPRKREGRLQK